MRIKMDEKRRKLTEKVLEINKGNLASTEEFLREVMEDRRRQVEEIRALEREKEELEEDPEDEYCLYCGRY